MQQRPTPPTPIRPVPVRFRARVWTDVARIFSTICNPFLTALALFVILAYQTTATPVAFWLQVVQSTFFTSIAPMLAIFWMYATGRISDLDMSIREERSKVFGIFVVFYVLGAIELYVVHAPKIVIATMAGYAVSSVLVQAITQYWKISTHALGVTAPIVVLIAVFSWLPLPLLVLIPVVGWARVYLHAHTVLQVVAGTVLGGATTFLLLRLFGLA